VERGRRGMLSGFEIGDWVGCYRFEESLFRLRVGVGERNGREVFESLGSVVVGGSLGRIYWPARLGLSWLIKDIAGRRMWL